MKHFDKPNRVQRNENELILGLVIPNDRSMSTNRKTVDRWRYMFISKEFLPFDKKVARLFYFICSKNQ